MRIYKEREGIQNGSSDILTLTLLWTRRLSFSRHALALVRHLGRSSPTSCSPLNLVLLMCSKRQLRPDCMAYARSLVSSGVRCQVRSSFLVRIPIIHHPSYHPLTSVGLGTLVIFSYILQNSIPAVSTSVVARLGSDQLSVAAFSLMLAYVTG
jgi:hypothetical protein